MITIPRSIYAALVADCLRRAPVEACGVLIGPAGDGRVHRSVEMDNALRSSSFYSFHPEDQREVWRAMDESGEDPVAIYHSHTMAPPPNRRGWDLSMTDIAAALDPRIAHLVVSVSDPDHIRVAMWRVQGGVSTQVTWSVVD